MILSNYKNLSNSSFDPLDQLKLLTEKCNKISSNLYRVNALYLEELRNFLPQAIRSSLFSLVTDQIRNGSGFSTIKSRRRFQLKIDQIVSNNISLLTIEHLNELARKIEEENVRNINQAKDEMVNALKEKNNPGNFSSSNSIDSIDISSLPPLENLSIIEGWNGELNSPYSIDNEIDYVTSKKDEVKSDNNEPRLEDGFMKDDDNIETLNIKGNEIELLRSIFALADESTSNQLDSKDEDLNIATNSYVDLKNNRLLPQSPIGLYEWMLSIDTALSRRLRDLSHAINSELLRSGLVNTLVPLNILDAAMAGQLISSKSISNILTLKLPINSSFAPGGIDIDCLLITPSDLEFDNPRLRKNRTHIKYFQNVLLGMIKQQRYWQGRSLAEEVSKKWWKDTTKI